jgi:HrpA-like RNA helicase
MGNREQTADSRAGASSEMCDVNPVVDFEVPEIKRVCLDELVLTLLLYDHLCHGHPQNFLNQCPEPPGDELVQAAINKLLAINAISVALDGGNKTGSYITSSTRTSTALLPPQKYFASRADLSEKLILTPLGYHLARLSMDVCLGKMLIMSCVLMCVEPMLTVAAMLCGKSPFLTPTHLGKAEEAYRAHCRFTKRESSKKKKEPPTAGAPEGSQDADEEDDSVASDATIDAEIEDVEDNDVAYINALGHDRQLRSTPFGGSKSDSNIFEIPRHAKKIDKTLGSEHSPIFFSDHLAAVRAYEHWLRRCKQGGTSNARLAAHNSADRYAVAKEFCKKFYLSHTVFLEMHKLRELFRRQLLEAGLLTRPFSNNEPVGTDVQVSPALLRSEEGDIIDMDEVEAEAETTTEDSLPLTNVLETDVSSSISSPALNAMMHPQTGTEEGSINGRGVRSGSSSESELNNVVRCCLCAGKVVSCGPSLYENSVDLMLFRSNKLLKGQVS